MPILLKRQVESCYQRFNAEQSVKFSSVPNNWKIKNTGYEKLDEENMTNPSKTTSRKVSVIDTFRKFLKKNRKHEKMAEADSVSHIPVDTHTINKGSNFDDDFDINPGLDLRSKTLCQSELLIDFETKMVSEDQGYVNFGYLGQMDKASTSSSSSSGSLSSSARPRLTRQNAVSEEKIEKPVKLDRKNTVIEVTKTDNGALTLVKSDADIKKN